MDLQMAVFGRRLRPNVRHAMYGKFSYMVCSSGVEGYQKGGSDRATGVATRLGRRALGV